MTQWNIVIEIEDVWVDWVKDEENTKECVFINDITKNIDKLKHEDMYDTIKKCFRCSQNEVCSKE